MKYKYINIVILLFIIIFIGVIIKYYDDLKINLTPYVYPEFSKYNNWKGYVDDRFLDESKNLKLVMNEHHSGFFCNFNRLIHYLMLFPNIVEIEFNIKSDIGKHKPFVGDKVEIFSTLFEYYKEPYKKVDDILNISGNDFLGLPTGGDTTFFYYNHKRSKLDAYSDTFSKYIKLRPHIQNKLDLMTKEMRSNCDQVIGIFVRSEALGKEQPSGRMPTREQYLNAIKKLDTKTKKTKFFLRVDNYEDLEFYKENLSPNYYTNIKRGETNKGDAPHSYTKEFKPIEELEDTYLEIALLSKCEILIHCSSNMVIASLYMNKQQQSICVSDPPSYYWIANLLYK
jgi:hypothetical protein